MKIKKGIRRSPVEGTFRYLLLTFMALTALVPGYIMFTASFKTQEQFLRAPFGIPLHLSFGGYSESTIDYLLPASTAYLHKNTDGDGILNSAAKLPNNEDIVEYLWF